MLIVVIGDNKEYRTKRITAMREECVMSEVIVLDDTVVTVADIEQYLYPSLFSISAPLVHIRFVLDTKEKELTTILLKKIIASPTIFLFEELSLSKPFITNLKKQGAIIHDDAPKKTNQKADNLFAVTSLITITSKKDRWLSYQKAITQYPIEAILGMLYWKVRDMVLKEKNNTGSYHVLYTALLAAHAKAWQEGTPLTLAIEKVLLTH